MDTREKEVAYQFLEINSFCSNDVLSSLPDILNSLFESLSSHHVFLKAMSTDRVDASCQHCVIVQKGVAFFIHVQPKLGSSLDQDSNKGVVIVSHGSGKGRLVLVALGVQISAMLNQQLGHVELVFDAIHVVLRIRLCVLEDLIAVALLLFRVDGLVALGKQLGKGGIRSQMMERRIA